MTDVSGRPRPAYREWTPESVQTELLAIADTLEKAENRLKWLMSQNGAREIIFNTRTRTWLTPNFAGLWRQVAEML